jgi:hypothetical protein
MAKSSKKDTELKNYNPTVGKAYHVSKNGVINVDLHDKDFKNEFMKQLRRIKEKRNKIVSKSREGETELA